MWSCQVERRVPEGNGAAEILRWDLQNHSLSRPIGGRVQIYVLLRRERPREHYLMTGGLRDDAPMWAPVPQGFLRALVRALKESQILAGNATIAGIGAEAFWAPEWDTPGYSIEILPASEPAESPAACRYHHHLFTAEVEGDPSFRPPAIRRGSSGSGLEPVAKSRWLARLLWSVWPYRGERCDPGPLAVRIQVTRRPGHGRPDPVRMVSAVFWALAQAYIVRADLVAISEIGVKIEPGPDPRTTVEVWRLPDVANHRVVA